MSVDGDQDTCMMFSHFSINCCQNAFASGALAHHCRGPGRIAGPRAPKPHDPPLGPALRAVEEDREYRSLIHAELGFEADGGVAPEWLPERSHDSGRQSGG